MDDYAELLNALRGGRQCDEEGVEIIMSRQACVEAADEIESMSQRVKMLESEVVANEHIARDLENKLAALKRSNETLRQWTKELLEELAAKWNEPAPKPEDVK